MAKRLGGDLGVAPEQPTEAEAPAVPDLPTVEELFAEAPASERGWQYAAFLAHYRCGQGRRMGREEFNQRLSALLSARVDASPVGARGGDR